MKEENELEQKHRRNMIIQMFAFFAVYYVTICIIMILRTGSVKKGSVLRIIAQYQQFDDIDENAKFLEKEFAATALGYIMPGSNAKYAVEFNERGIVMSRGESVLETSSFTVTWQQAAERIEQLLQEGRYADGMFIDNAKKTISEANANEIREFTADEQFAHREGGYFASEQLKEMMVLNGSGYQNGKIRIYEYYADSTHSSADRVKFLTKIIAHSVIKSLFAVRMKPRAP